MQPLTRTEIHLKFINIFFLLGAGNVLIGRISVEIASFADVKSNTSLLKREGLNPVVECMYITPFTFSWLCNSHTLLKGGKFKKKSKM